MMNSKSTLIKAATGEDTMEILELVNSAYRGNSARAGWTHEADLLGGTRIEFPELLSEINHPRKTILCLRQSERGPIFGVVSLEWVSDIPLKGEGCYLGMLTVHPRFQESRFWKTVIRSFRKSHKTKGIIVHDSRSDSHS